MCALRKTARETATPAKRPRLSEAMRSAGIRMTQQRRVLADLLDDATEHLDAETVVARARLKDPTIHRATVYRTLQLMKRHGLVDELDLMHVEGERHYYEVHPGNLHIHLVCTRCRRVEEPSGPFWEGVKRRVETECGFRPEVVRIEMAGVCAKCGKRAERGSRGRRGTRPGG